MINGIDLSQIGVSIKPSDAYSFDFTSAGPEALLSTSVAASVAPTGTFDGDATSCVTPVNTGGPATGVGIVTLDGELETPEEKEMTRVYNVQQLSPKMRRLTDLAIVTEFVAGSPVDVIAKNYHVAIGYVQKLRGEWLKACKLQESFDYRYDLKILSLEAIRDGLMSKADPFKRMSGAIRIMQGIGEFKPDQINVAVLQRIENVPVELRDRYLTSTVEDEHEKVIDTHIDIDTEVIK